MDEGKRGEEVSGNKVQGSDGCRNPSDSLVGNQISEVDINCYIIHRVGPRKEFERLYGPFIDKHKARINVANYVEKFMAENGLYNPRAAFKNFDFVKIEVSGMSAKGEGPLREHFYFIIKPVSD